MRKIQKPEPKNRISKARSMNSDKLAKAEHKQELSTNLESVARAGTKWVGYHPTSQLESLSGLGLPVKAPCRCGPLGN